MAANLLVFTPDTFSEKLLDMAVENCLKTKKKLIVLIVKDTRKIKMAVEEFKSLSHLGSKSSRLIENSLEEHSRFLI